jgi:hypothetical protein
MLERGEADAVHDFGPRRALISASSRPGEGHQAACTISKGMVALRLCRRRSPRRTLSERGEADAVHDFCGDTSRSSEVVQ